EVGAGLLQRPRGQRRGAPGPPGRGAAAPGREAPGADHHGAEVRLLRLGVRAAAHGQRHVSADPRKQRGVLPPLRVPGGRLRAGGGARLELPEWKRPPGEAAGGRAAPALFVRGPARGFAAG
ncbi:unnamed protein product, partial [Effrenium voratum]